MNNCNEGKIGPPDITNGNGVQIEYFGEEHNSTETKVPVPNTLTCFQSFAGLAGNVMEWYDFAIFGFFGDIISEVFFPKQAGHAALVESFAVFGGAFLMRPVGGIMLGYIGDVYGRKKSLEISIFLMAIPTFLMGLLPSYESVGWPAILLLIIVRLLQGLSVGGQLMSSLVFTLENSPSSAWGYHGSFVLAAASLGTLLGGVVGTLMRKLCTHDQLLRWGWRIPFLSGIFVSIFGIYLRYYVPENDSHLAGRHGSEKINPIKVAFSAEHRQSLLSSIFVPMLWSGGFYTCFVWMAIYMTDLIQNPIPNAFFINSLALFLSNVLLFPVAGTLSDIYSRRIIMTIGGVMMFVFAPFLVIIIGQGKPIPSLLAQIFLGCLLSLWGSPMCTWLAESFPPEIRLTSVSVGYNVAHALIGGSAPALATLMVDEISPKSPGFFISLLACLSLLGLAIAPKPGGYDLFQCCFKPKESNEIYGVVESDSEIVDVDDIFTIDDDDEKFNNIPKIT